MGQIMIIKSQFVYLKKLTRKQISKLEFYTICLEEILKTYGFIKCNIGTCRVFNFFHITYQYLIGKTTSLKSEMFLLMQY